MKTRIRFIIAIAAGLVLPAAANACTVCMGEEGSNVADGSNGAIFLMLGFVGLMLSSFGGFMFYLARRERRPMAPHEEFARSISGVS